MSSETKLHLGCGSKHLDGFINIDIMDNDNIDMVQDIKNLEKFENESVDEIYASHVLEHFGRLEYIDVLKEWYRVLKQGGILRLAVPDFESVAKCYVEDKLELEKLIGLLYGGQDYKYNYHYMTYDEKSLNKVLTGIGFKETARYDWREFLPEDFDDFSRAYIPHMDFENGRLMSLNLIAKK